MAHLIDEATACGASASRGMAAETNDMPVYLRASSDPDQAFLLRVFAGTRAGEFSLAGWDHARVEAMVAQQFALQDGSYRGHYRQAYFDVVMRGATPIGRLYHDWSGAVARVIEIALLPEHRGNGIGTHLMRSFVADAARRALAAELYVEQDNPVRALYRRLGFEPVGEHGIYVQMRRAPLPFEDGSPTTSMAALRIDAP